MGKIFTDVKLGNLIRFWFITAFPKLSTKLGLSMQNSEVVKYFCNIIKNTIEYRKKNDIQRNDFIQMMLQLKDKGNIELKTWDSSDDYLKSDSSHNTIETFGTLYKYAVIIIIYYNCY